MRLWNGWGNEDSDLTMELSDGLRALLEALVGPVSYTHLTLPTKA